MENNKLNQSNNLVERKPTEPPQESLDVLYRRFFNPPSNQSPSGFFEQVSLFNPHLRSTTSNKSMGD